MNYVKPYICASRHHTATGKCHETIKSSCQTHEKHWCGVGRFRYAVCLNPSHYGGHEVEAVRLPDRQTQGYQQELFLSATPSKVAAVRVKSY
ncbi:MAG: hypothetical protein QXE52_08005 [Candidatus Caldarchaeum sp.]